MTSPLVRTVRAYAADARAAFTAAPVEVALGVLLAVALSAKARTEGFSEDDFMRLLASVALALPLVFALSVLRARGMVSAAVRWGGTAAALVACAWFGATVLHRDRDAEWWRWALLQGAAVLLLVLTAALPRRKADRRQVWAFAWRLLVRLVGIGLYAVAFYGLLAGAVAAVVSLFDLSRPGHLYVDLAGAVFFGFATWIFVGGIHRLSAPPEAGVPESVSRVGRWLYAPVLVIYLLILYAYAARVLLTGELPRNLVSPLVIAAGVIGLAGAALLEPVHADDEHRGMSMLVRAIPALLLPLVPLAAWALLARLGEYGWTEFRYVRLAAVFAIGVLAVMGTARLVRRRPPLLTAIPAVFAAVLLLAAAGPWSAPAVSRRDQAARLRAALREARVDPRRLPREPVTVDSAVYNRIDSGAGYLARAHGMGALRAVVPALPDSVLGPWRLSEHLGIRGGCRPHALVFGLVEWDGGVRGVLGGTVVQLSVHKDTSTVRMAGAATRLWAEGDRVMVDAGGWRASADLAPLRRMLEARGGGCDPGSAGRVGFAAADALVPVRDASGALRAQLLVTHLVVAPTPDGPDLPPPGINSFDAMLFLPD